MAAQPLQIRVLAGLSSEMLCTVTGIPRDWDMCDLKSEIHALAGIPEIEQRLVLHGRVLDKNQILGDVFPDAAGGDIVLLRIDPVRARVIRELEIGKVKLQDVGEEYRCDREAVLATVKNNGVAIKYASEDLKDDLEVALAAMKSRGRALEYLSKRLQNHRRVVVAAVEQDGLAIEHASLAVREDREAAVMRFFPENMKRDPEIVFAAGHGVDGTHTVPEWLRKLHRELR
eukprot:gnl/TRDRNA2_/TRDRNA2_154579_c0_seq3.p1 gnl/TRDRNA2_/TRDRNA2_154579_c0~~gnl/TRDRNA2_/TRDRNA2_154579_c0_seq3.p1  ORF type:complete len:230 (+),score=36.29 gnl/TRDRNA2_/TRDRNA2_154579_c0_seq3:46-735(+)